MGLVYLYLYLYSNMKFHFEAMVPCVQTDTTKLIVAFPKFAITLKGEHCYQHKHFPRQISSWPKTMREPTYDAKIHTAG